MLFIREKTNNLDPLPNIGKMVPEVAKSEIQELHIYSYRIMYEVAKDNHHYVLAVIHKRRDFAAEDLP